MLAITSERCVSLEMEKDEMLSLDLKRNGTKNPFYGISEGFLVFFIPLATAYDLYLGFYSKNRHFDILP